MLLRFKALRYVTLLLCIVLPSITEVCESFHPQLHTYSRKIPMAMQLTVSSNGIGKAKHGVGAGVHIAALLGFRAAGICRDLEIGIDRFQSLCFKQVCPRFMHRIMLGGAVWERTLMRVEV